MSEQALVEVVSSGMDAVDAWISRFSLQGLSGPGANSISLLIAFIFASAKPGNRDIRIRIGFSSRPTPDALWKSTTYV